MTLADVKEKVESRLKVLADISQAKSVPSAVGPVLPIESGSMQRVANVDQVKDKKNRGSNDGRRQYDGFGSFPAPQDKQAKGEDINDTFITDLRQEDDSIDEWHESVFMWMLKIPETKKQAERQEKDIEDRGVTARGALGQYRGKGHQDKEQVSAGPVEEPADPFKGDTQKTKQKGCVDGKDIPHPIAGNIVEDRCQER